jgi:hypothetical protein
MPLSGGLLRFQPHLNPAVLRDVAAWNQRGGGLARLHGHLEATLNEKAFFDRWAEAMVARHLLHCGGEIETELQTPSGRTADLHVRLPGAGRAAAAAPHSRATAGAGEGFYIHVKRLNTDRPFRRRLAVSSRLRSLERINRPYVVSIHLEEGAGDEQVRRFVTSATEFIRHARIGDELMVHDDRSGEAIGGCRIVAPYEGTHVNLALGLPSGFIDEAPRMQKLMRRAYLQFMPRAWNVIMIGSPHPQDAADFESALLGSHVERWDTFPPRGRRIAHGRAEDGFWSQRRFAESSAAAWFLFHPRAEHLDARLWVREDGRQDEAMIATLRTLLHRGAAAH